MINSINIISIINNIIMIIISIINRFIIMIIVMIMFSSSSDVPVDTEEVNRCGAEDEEVPKV